MQRIYANKNSQPPTIINPEFATSNNLRDINKEASPFIKIPFKSIYNDNNPMETLARMVNDDRPIDVMKSIRQPSKPQIRNQEMNDYLKDAAYITFDKSTKDLISANSSLKSGKLEMFKEIAGRYPTEDELKTGLYNPNSKSSDEVIPTKTKVEPREIITISFDEPYTSDKIQFDNYIKDLIDRGVNYKIIPQQDQSVVVQHYSSLKDKATKSEPQGTTKGEFIDKYELINPINNKLVLSKLDTLTKKKLIDGLRLFNTPFDGITERINLKYLLRDAIIKHVELSKQIKNNELLNKIKIDNKMDEEDKEKELSSVLSPSKINFDDIKNSKEEEPKKMSKISRYADKEDQKNYLIGMLKTYTKSEDKTELINEINSKVEAKVIKEIFKSNGLKLGGRNPNKSNYLGILFNHFNPIAMVEERKERDIRLEKEEKPKDKPKGRDIRPEKISITTGNGILKNIKISLGEIRAGNDNPQIKKQLKKDIIKAYSQKQITATKVRDIIKNIL